MKKNFETSINYDEYLKNIDIKNGLNDSEVLNRQKVFGLNEIKKQKSKNFFQLFVGQLVELMSLLLFVSGIIAIGLSIYQHIDSQKNNYLDGDLPSVIILNYVQGAVLLLTVFANAFFGALQEKKSNNSIEALQKMSCLKAKVIRGGQTQLIDSAQLTVGDIIVVEAGDVIPADCKLLEVSNLKVIESILTGESLPIEKKVCKNLLAESTGSIGDRVDEIFSNSNVVNGRAIAVVTKIGINTEIGKIAELLNTKEKMYTPLQLKLNKLGKVIGLIGIILTIISFIFALLVLQNVFVNGVSALTPSIILAISIATAAIPEGLNAVVNIVLAIGVNKMAKRNGLIKKLTAVETLGSTAVICSDKTGTLTMNKMTIVKMWVPGSKEEDVDKIDKLSSNHLELLRDATLCTDCVINEDDPNAEKIGDPTELAIVELALQKGYSDIEWEKKYKRLADIPFDSDRKLMTVINKIDNKIYAIVKGAPDVLLSRCKSSPNLKEAKLINNKWSDNANRVLAVGVKELKSIPKELDDKKIESDLNFIGLIGMIDPPREEVKASIKECIAAGIKPVMITGDHLNTAVAIAKDLNIFHEGDLAITGVDLDKLSDEELFNNIEKYSVYARVSPENKIRIVKAWQYRDQVVSMTGDGVNDAPALQAADIGCAMGITGTDVSKGAADMILTDDNFSTIVESVKLGRTIYENIRRIILYLLSSNIAGIVAIALGIIIMYFVFDPKYGAWGQITSNDLSSLSGILNSMQLNSLARTINQNIVFHSTISTILILINNIIVETIPGIALGLQDLDMDLMNRRPRSKFESVFADGLVKKICLVGIFIGLLSLIAFILGSYIAIATGVPALRFFYGSIATFLTFSFSGIIKSMWLSSQYSFFNVKKWKESRLVYASCGFSLLIIIAVTLIPQAASLFGERPSLSDFTTNSFDNDVLSIIQDPKNIDILKKDLFGGQDNNSSVSGYIWLLAILLSIFELIVLELYKLIENKFLNKVTKEVITEFKIIEKPIPWYQNNKLFNKIYTKINHKQL